MTHEAVFNLLAIPSGGETDQKMKGKVVDGASHCSKQELDEEEEELCVQL